MANRLHGDNPRTIRSPKKREKFLEYLRQTCNVTKACELSRISRRSAYEWRADDESFRADWQKALEIATDLLEDEAVRRAKDGVDRPVYQGGELVGHVREYSDTLLIFLLKGAKPEKYRERFEQRNSGTLTVEHVALTHHQRVARLKELLAKAESRAQKKEMPDE